MKPKSGSRVTPATTIERRSFIWKAGAALSAGLASAAATAAASERMTDRTGDAKEQLERLSSQMGILEETNAIRTLHHAFGDFLNKGLYAEIIELFAEDSEVHFNGGIFVGKNRGVRRLYVEHFGRRCAGDEDGPVHVCLLGQTPHQDIVEVAADRRSARARFHCLMQTEAAMPSSLPLVQMARQQGQGAVRWWESGIFENSYVKNGEFWKIKQLLYRPVSPGEIPRALLTA